MNPDDHDYTMWWFLSWAFSLATLTVVLWLTASNFDRTEGRSIAGQAVASAAGFALIELIRKRWSK